MTRSDPTLALRQAWQGLGPSARRLLLAVLALVLLQAQGLGHWHRVAHGGLHAGGSAAMQSGAGAAGDSLAAAPASTGQSGRAQRDPGLFGHDADDEPGCRLFDHLVSADALLSAPAAILLQDALPAEAGTMPADCPGRAPRHYQARAPPRA